MYKKLRNVPALLRRITSNKKYIHEIDGLRFIAILPVLFQHLSERIIKYTPMDNGVSWSDSYLVSIFSRGTFGVFLFFSISGFILSLPFGKAILKQKEQPLYSKYIIRRLTRLEPPFIIWMTLFSIVLYIQGNYSGDSLLGHYLASIFYSHNIIYNTYSIINPVAWSLEVEFQFYLLAPLLAYAYFGISNSCLRRILITVLIILTPLFQHFFGWNAMPWKATLIGQLQHFLIGFLIADLYLNRQLLFYRKNHFWDLIGLLALILMAWSWSNDWYKEWLFSISTGLLFLSAFNGTFFNKSITNPWVTAIGGICYTIYLIHLPLLELFTQWSAPNLSASTIFFSFAIQFVLWVPIILLLSGIFYLLIEKPFMDPGWLSLMKNKFSNSFSIKNIQTVIMNKKVPLLLLPLIFSPIAKMICQTQVDSNSTNSQSVMEVNYDNPDITNLMEIEQLVKMAITHSPLLKSKDVRIANYNNELKMNNRKWADYISVGGTYLYGSSFYTDDTQGSLGLSNFRTTNRNNSIANITLSARIPMSELFNRKVRNDKIYNQQKIENYEKESIQNTIREVIIKHHNNLKTKLKAINIKAKEVESLKMAANYAEQFMREGEIDIDQYTTSLSRLSRAEYELLSYQSEANLAFLLLQEIIGSSPSNEETIEQ